MSLRHLLLLSVSAAWVAACGGNGEVSAPGSSPDLLHSDQGPPTNDQRPPVNGQRPSGLAADESPPPNDQQPPVNTDRPATQSAVDSCEALCERMAAECGESVDCTESCSGLDEVERQCPAEVQALFGCINALDLSCDSTDKDVQAQLEDCDDELRGLVECATGFDLGDFSFFGNDQSSSNGVVNGPPDFPQGDGVPPGTEPSFPVADAGAGF